LIRFRALQKIAHDWHTLPLGGQDADVSRLRVTGGRSLGSSQA